LSAILNQKPNKYSPKSEEKICRYASGSYKLKTVNNTDREILVIIHTINSFNYIWVLKNLQLGQTVKQYANIIIKLIAKRVLLEDGSCLKILLSGMVIK
jgi:hypothetical protein